MKKRWQIESLERRGEVLLQALQESRLTEPLVSVWLTLVDRHCKAHGLVCHQDFPPDHPVQELARCLQAVLIKHQGLGALAVAMVDKGKYIYIFIKSFIYIKIMHIPQK